MNKNVPKRRFKGYTKPWEESKLEEKVQFYSGLTYKPADLRKEGTLVLRSSNIKESKLVLSDNVFVNSQVVNVSNVKCNDIIMVVRNGSRELIGKHTLLRENLQDTVIGAFMTGIRAENYEFINVLFDTDLFKNLVQINMGATINQITGYMFSNMKFNFPSDEEQRLIGSFFKNLDEKIDKQEKKVEKLKNLKKAYLSEIFPAEGELSPKRRFKGFTEPWGEKKLDKISDRLDNQRIPISENKRIPGSTPYFGANGIQDFVKGYTHEGEHVLLAEDGANDLIDYPVQYVTGKIWVNNHAHVLRGKENILDNKFLYVAIKNMDLRPYLVGGGRAKLNADIMMNLIFLIPSFKEQKLIGSFFKKLDDEINLEQKKLEKLKQLKQAYLEEMFV